MNDVMQVIGFLIQTNMAKDVTIAQQQQLIDELNKKLAAKTPDKTDR
jgi:hypothetical protein